MALQVCLRRRTIASCHSHWLSRRSRRRRLSCGLLLLLLRLSSLRSRGLPCRRLLAVSSTARLLLLLLLLRLLLLLLLCSFLLSSRLLATLLLLLLLLPARLVAILLLLLGAFTVGAALTPPAAPLALLQSGRPHFILLALPALLSLLHECVENDCL